LAVSFFKWRREENKGTPENSEETKIKEQVK
jgi:hypothetical protein